ncbi:MAG TPA: hypothetical protein VFM43_01040 [Gaiellaceae bacterium]|nr:hypothetical protein [Gaiellaceae bacterium]
MSPGQRSYLFREVNDRIYELLEGEPDLPAEFLCECGSDCGRRVSLLPAAYATLRGAGEAVESPLCVQSSDGVGSDRAQLADGVPALS